MSSHESPIRFGIADYVFLALMLGGSLGIGLYMAVIGRKKTSQEDYLLGGRRMKALPVCMSLFATFQSAISLLGFPTEIYSYGTMYVYYGIGLIFSYLLAIFTTIPLMYPLGLTSVNEYLALRYRCKTIQSFGAAIGVISSLAYMTVALLSPALALETAVGIPLWMSIIVVGVVGTVYTTFGGIKSVIWTDVFQTVFIYGGIFMVLVKGIVDAGGVGDVWKIAKDNNRIKFDEVSLDPRVRHTVWNQAIGSVYHWMAFHFSQSSVQRIVSTTSAQEANKVYIITIPLVIVYHSILIFTGLVIFGYFFALGCDPLAAGIIKNKNQLVPYFVLHASRYLPGLAGFYISTIFSGALSTLSSGINSISANVVQDGIAKFLRDLPESVVTKITKVLVFFFGIVIIGLAYVAREFQGPVVQLAYTVSSAINGPLLGLFILGGLFPQANYIGVSIGLFAGTVISSWHAIGSRQFGFVTPTLPPGPISNCQADNLTVFSMTTSSLYLDTNETSLLTSSIRENMTLHPDYLNTDSVISGELQDRPFSFYDISYTLNPVMGTSVTLLVGLISSLIIRPFLKHDWRPQSRLLFPFCRRFWYSDKDVLSTELQPRNKEVGGDNLNVRRRLEVS